MNKRICSIFLLLTLLLALLPLQANAVTAGMAALDMQEISRTEYQISKDVKEYEWLLNNGSLTKQMVGHVMEVKVPEHHREGRKRRWLYRPCHAGDKPSDAVSDEQQRYGKSHLH